jgi:hypothetical protein
MEQEAEDQLDLELSFCARDVREATKRLARAQRQLLIAKRALNKCRRSQGWRPIGKGRWAPPPRPPTTD